MNEMNLENRLSSIASAMEYPPTPDIAESIMARIDSSRGQRFISRKLAWSLTIMLILVSSLMFIPTARAAIIEFIQIGIVRIFPRPTQPPAEVFPTGTPEVFMPLTATPEATSPSLITVLDEIAGETTLENAQQIAAYPILLPTYPEKSTPPDRVYVQEAEGVMTILVWVDPQQPRHVTMSLHIIPTGHWAINKFGPVVVQETQVGSHSAVWAVGPYPLRMMGKSEIQVIRLIEGHVLIWADGDVTYRLETDLPLDEAVKIAESLKPIP